MQPCKLLLNLGVLTALIVTVSAQGFGSFGGSGGSSNGGFGNLFSNLGGSSGFGNLGLGNPGGSGGLGQGGFGNLQNVFSNLQKSLSDMLARFRNGLGF